MSTLIITALQIEGFKKIVACNIDPENGKPVIITGDNAAGKSSVLDGIMFALTGKGAEKPLNDEFQKGKVTVMLGGEERTLEVKRTFTNDSKALVVRDAEGKQLSSPQEVINGLVGALAFDPEKFLRMKDKERSDALRIAAGLDFDALDDRRERAFNERTTINRMLKESEGEKKALGMPITNPGESKSTVDLMSNLRRHQEAINQHQEARNDVDRYKHELDEVEAQLKHLKLVQKSAKQTMDTARGKMLILTKPAVEAEERIPGLQAEIEGVDEHASRVSAYRTDNQKRLDLSARITKLSKAQFELNDELQKVDAEKEKAIKDASLPDGVTFGEEGETLYWGRPFSDLNTAKQWEAATQLAALQDPELGVVFIREAALMNKKARAFIIGWAKDRHIQLWMEKFQEEPSDEGIHIVEGEIASINGKGVA